MGQLKGCPFFVLERWMMDDAVIRSLEAAAGQGDPGPIVYARLFAAHPELEALFVRDRDGSVRGHMFQEMINALIDLRGANIYGANLFRIERVNHEQLGVKPELYPAIFAILRDVVRDMAAQAWTDEMERAWSGLLAQVDALLQPDIGYAAADSPA
jgi:hemoglobin-like flavoprotein